MKYICSGAKFPRDTDLLRQMNAAAIRLQRKITALDISSIGISEYSRRYLSEHRLHLFSVLQRIAFILSWTILNHRKPLSEIVFVDYGGGTGFLALFAKELGIGTVIYNDIYDVSCNDAETIGKCLDVPADHFVHGGVTELLDFLKFHNTYCDALASFDVLEHIYDVDHFLTQLCTVPHAPTRFLMASSANPRNPIIRMRLMKMHRKYEYQDRKRILGHKERDSLRAYYSIRVETIKKTDPELTPREIQILAERTRGKTTREVLDCVANYKETKALPPLPSHPTNTCDPFTGNWQEQLLDLNHLRSILLYHGLHAEILSGYWMTDDPLKAVIAQTLNLLISNLGDSKGLWVAPFYALVGTKDINQRRFSKMTILPSQN